MQRTAVITRPDTGPLFVTAESQADEALHRAREADKRRAQQQLAEVAAHLTEVNPDNPITECARFSTAVLVAGTVGRVRPLLRELPLVEKLPGTTRREYAQIILGTDGDLPPSPIHIPGIPQQPHRPNNQTEVAA